MNETSLTQDLIEMCRTAMPGCVTLKISAQWNNAGYPDLTHTWRRLTSWWEVKHYDNEKFASPPLQHVTCRRLAHAGVCHYIIYEERHHRRRTLIVHPELLDRWEDSADYCDGFNHLWVARFMAHVHMEAA